MWTNENVFVLLKAELIYLPEENIVAQQVFQRLASQMSLL